MLRTAIEPLSGAIKPRVVSLPPGWGHGRPGTRMSVGNGSPGVNTNALSPPTFVDEPSGNGARNGIPVTVVHVGQVTPAGYVPRRNAGKNSGRASRGRCEMNDHNTLDASGQTRRPHSDQWYRLLTEGHAPLVRARRVFRYLPSAPRCKMCNNPFGRPVGRILGVAGFKPSRKNPDLCTRCCDAVPHGGAEVDIAVLLADVRGSTTLGEQTPAADFATLLDRFYAAATQTLLRRDAVVDKLIGDEVMAFFVRGISGPDYRHQAVRAGLELLSAIGYGRDGGPWLNVGAAVNAGPAYVGNVGGAVVDFTALGDSVNAAARMQQAAAGGELLVAAGVADDLVAHGSRRQPALRGPRPADRSLRVDHPGTSEEARWRTTACTASVACTRVSWIRTRPRPAQ